jgi:hypothetical protein
LAISPDGRKIVFAKGHRQERAVRDAILNGTHIRQSTQTAVTENWPDWRPFS